MLEEIKDKFIVRWNKYLPGAELPITFYYTDDKTKVEPNRPSADWRCLIADLGKVRHGQSVRFDKFSIGCGGGRRNSGFEEASRPNFEYFLSCGIPGEVEGIRYKKTPEMVKLQMASQVSFEAPGEYIVFKRWDMLDNDDEPLAVIFFAVPDVIAALFGLANFDETDPNMVITPTGAGCSQIIYYPYRELQSNRNRSILGMFDLSARPYVPPNVLTFAVPMPKFLRMIDNMDESFLITETWGKIRKRL
ncbi:MAG: hypothetical protein CVT49_14035 [candidate division Zixibacteria bacterium HGW-Zixibacteria-1]|nr:MAG: hypothetical protein CVT49_14035 [candidate division Zixibacteria bacterium HGW-Zixibacteria-1]